PHTLILLPCWPNNCRLQRRSRAGHPARVFLYRPFIGGPMKLAMTLVPLFAGLVFAQDTTRTETTTTTWNGTLVDDGCRTTRTKETTSSDSKTETKTTV